MKYVRAFVVAIAFLFITQASVQASVSVRLSEPKSPTNLTSFKLSFVALDTDNQTITVTCYRKSPGDSGYTQFDSAKTLLPGGNSDTCETSNSFINQNGTYQFKVVASAGSTTVDSNTISVDYSGSGPETPGDYHKDQIGSCQYTISFKTANDGKTVKVEIYRSNQNQFTADSGTKVGEVGLGPNQTGSFTDNPPDCSQTYFYAIRAFDNSGNGSGLVGDQGTTVAITNPSASSSGAILVRQSGVGQPGRNGSVLGESTKEENATPSADTTAPVVAPSPSPSPISTSPRINNLVWYGLIGFALILLFLLLKPKKAR